MCDITKTIIETYEAKIYVGFRPSYSDNIFPIDYFCDLIQNIADKGGMCVTITKTKFIYKDGSEDGAIIGFINYPRFPKPRAEIKADALCLADNLKHNLKQIRVTVVCSDETIMLG